jgi:acyl carrier protein
MEWYSSDEILDIISEISRIDRAEITPEVLIREELGIDSLQAMAIVARLEKRFSIRLDESKLFEVATVGDFVRLLQEKLG